MKARKCLVDAAVLTLLLLTPGTEAIAQGPGVRPPEAPASAPRAAADQESELVELLDVSLGSLADRSRRGRQVGGYVMIGLGAATAVGGAITLAVWDDEDADIVGYSLIGGGIILGGLSILPFKIRGEVERVYEEFSEMPASAPAQVRTKFAYGDRRFQELAQNRRTERYVGGAILLGVGISDLFLTDDPAAWISFGTPLVAGVTTLLVKSEEERRYESYQRAKEDLLAASDRAPTVGIGLTVLPRSGLAALVQVRF